MRKAKPKKRVILPDPVFNDQKVSKFVNHLMYDGKKNAVVITAQEMQAKDAYLIDLEEMPVKGMMCLQ